eukprot:scaffold65866_cov39-Phaeocystis_antarctica.AAC.1
MVPSTAAARPPPSAASSVRRGRAKRRTRTITGRPATRPAAWATTTFVATRTITTGGIGATR